MIPEDTCPVCGTWMVYQGHHTDEDNPRLGPVRSMRCETCRLDFQLLTPEQEQILVEQDLERARAGAEEYAETIRRPEFYSLWVLAGPWMKISHIRMTDLDAEDLDDRVGRHVEDWTSRNGPGLYRFRLEHNDGFNGQIVREWEVTA